MVDSQQSITEAKQATVSEKLKQTAISCLDLTSLNETDTEDDIRALCQKAVSPKGNVAAVCVAPQFVDFIKRNAVDPAIKIATVANFPEGNQPASEVLECIQDALDNGADEIDIVLPYEDYKAGDTTSAIQLIADAKQLCGTKTLKVILETGALIEPNLIAAASRDCLSVGADFLKTSTGKIATGATLEAAALMLQALQAYQQTNKRVVGFKASGGVRTAKDAAEYITLAQLIMGETWVNAETFRLGASSLLNELLA